MSGVRYDSSDLLHKTLAVLCFALLIEGHVAHGTRLTRYIPKGQATPTWQAYLAEDEDPKHPDLPVLLQRLSGMSDTQFYEVLHTCLQRAFVIEQASPALVASVPAGRILHGARIIGYTGHSISFLILKNGTIITQEQT